MTGPTVRPETSLVLIVNSMTIDACRRRAFVLILWMATPTGDNLVLAREWVLGFRMVEFAGAPTLVTMTVSAQLSQLTRMSILGLVAGVAI